MKKNTDKYKNPVYRDFCIELIEGESLLGLLHLPDCLGADSFRGSNLDNRHPGPESVETALVPVDHTSSR